MTDSSGADILGLVRRRFREIAERAGLLDATVVVAARALSPAEAIGAPERRDYPILVGKERMLEAVVEGSRGHAFTDSPVDFRGKLLDVLGLDFTSNRHRAIFIATLNAAMRSLGLIRRTVHCRDEDPEECGRRIAARLREDFGSVKIGLIGLNPAIAEHLVKAFGSGRVLITDMDPDNLGRNRFGVEIWDGGGRTRDLISASDVVLVTGTTFGNGTFDEIAALLSEHGKPFLVYGVTGAGVCELMGIERICPLGRDW